MVRAKMAVWELTEPPAVTKASTLLRSRRAVWLGARSSAARTAGSVRTRASSSVPFRMWMSRAPMSSTSAVRPCI